MTAGPMKRGSDEEGDYGELRFWLPGGGSLHFARDDRESAARNDWNRCRVTESGVRVNKTYAPVHEDEWCGERFRDD